MNKLSELNIELSVAEKIIRGFTEGQYHLLCGAGTSLDALGGDKQPLALAKKTAHAIADHVGLILEEHERDNLSFVYEEANAQFPEKLRSLLTARFTNCEPTWQSKIIDLHWQRIWTLNIDDVLENTFDNVTEKTRYNKISSISWRDSLRPVSASEKELQIVHLHGLARRLKNSRHDVVFSPLEYSEVVRALPPWHAAFQTSYVEEPFIICGATFTEEPDFIVATRMTNQSAVATGIPSLIVTPYFSDAQKARLRRFGLIPVECSGEAFFDALHADLNAYRKAHSEALKRYPIGVIERFSQQFRKLTKSDDTTFTRIETDFFSGDQPTWQDVISGRDTELTRTREAASLMRRDGPNCFVGLLCGSLATGKSSALLRIAMSALTMGFQPYFFRNEESVSTSSVIAFLELTPEAVLFFDEAADHSSAIGKIVSLCASKKIPCRIYAAERLRRLRGFRLDIGDAYLNEFYYRTLNDSDIISIITSRRTVGRLGKYSRNTNDEIKFLMQNTWKRELLESLSQIEFGEGFRSRISKYVRSELGENGERALVSLIACVHRFGFELPLTLALSHTRSVDRFKDLIEAGKTSEGIIVKDTAGIRLRHRIISEYVWRNILINSERKAAIIRIAQELAPLINPATIAKKSRPHRIVRELLDQDALVDDVGLDARRIFEELEPMYSWSSRFWDQRALLEYKLESHGKAYSFSQKAVSLEKHAFAYTTLGTICLKEAIRLILEESKRAKDFYFEGVESLDLARRASERQGISFEHPFVAFFSQTIKFVKLLPKNDPDYAAITELWHVWVKNAENSGCFQGQYGQERIREVNAIWMKFELSRQRELDKTTPLSTANIKPEYTHPLKRRRRRKKINEHRNQ